MSETERAERDRNQLVISLGEGESGEKLKKRIELAAARSGKKPSVWARERLLLSLIEVESFGDPPALPKEKT